MGVSLGHITFMYCGNHLETQPDSDLHLSARFIISQEWGCKENCLLSSTEQGSVLLSLLYYSRFRRHPVLGKHQARTMICISRGRGQKTSVCIQSRPPAECPGGIHTAALLSATPGTAGIICRQDLVRAAKTSCYQRQGMGSSKPLWQLLIVHFYFPNSPSQTMVPKPYRVLLLLPKRRIIWDPNPGEDLWDGLQGQTPCPATVPGPSCDPHHMAAWIIVRRVKPWPDTILIQVHTEGRRKK